MTTLQHIPRTLLQPSATNPRKHFDAQRQAELRASIEQHGVLQPLIVRPIAGRDGSDGQPLYEIVSGERRWRASEGTAAADALPCNVGTYDDLQVLEVQLIENVQRADLHPLEEAEGYGRLVHAPAGRSVDDIAHAVGMSRQHVYARLRLLGLTTDARAAFFAGRFGIGSALQIARLNTMHQADICTAIENDARRGSPWSADTIAHHIRTRYTLRLAGAPFDLHDAQLVPTAGSCAACPKRSGANPELFDDIGEADTCTDRSCFADKVHAHVAAAQRAVTERGGQLITGKEAERLLPTPDATVKGFLRLDRPSEFALSNKPLGEVIERDREVALICRSMGDDVPPVLVEVIPTPYARKLLADKGLLASESEADSRATKPRERETKPSKTETKPQRDDATSAARDTQPQADATQGDDIAPEATEAADAIAAIKVLQPYDTRKGKATVVPDAKVQRVRAEMAATELRRLLIGQRIGAQLRRGDSEGFPSHGLSHLVARSMAWGSTGEIRHAAQAAGVRLPEPDKGKFPGDQIDRAIWQLDDEGAARLAIMLLALQEELGTDEPDPATVVAQALGLQVEDLEVRAQAIAQDKLRTELLAIEPKSGAKQKRPGGNAKRPAAEKSAAPPVRYRNAATGETWWGRGRQPKWLQVALASGHTLAEFNANTTAPSSAPGETSQSRPLLERDGAAKLSPKVTAMQLSRARDHVIAHQRASLSSVQRELQVGYNTAARILDELQQHGVVSAQDENGLRTVLVARSQAA